MRRLLLRALLALACGLAQPVWVHAAEAESSGLQFTAARPLIGDLGFTLGDSLAAVQRALGTTAQPVPFGGDAIDPFRGSLLRLPAAGIWVYFDTDDRVRSVQLHSPFAAAVAGVRIGDLEGKVRGLDGATAHPLEVAYALSSFPYSLELGGARVGFELDWAVGNESAARIVLAIFVSATPVDMARDSHVGRVLLRKERRTPPGVIVRLGGDAGAALQASATAAAARQAGDSAASIPNARLAVVGDHTAVGVWQGDYCSEPEAIERSAWKGFAVGGAQQTWLRLPGVGPAGPGCAQDYTLTPQPGQTYIVRYVSRAPRCGVEAFRVVVGGDPVPERIWPQPARDCRRRQ